MQRILVNVFTLAELILLLSEFWYRRDDFNGAFRQINGIKCH